MGRKECPPFATGLIISYRAAHNKCKKYADVLSNFDIFIFLFRTFRYGKPFLQLKFIGVKQH